MSERMVGVGQGILRLGMVLLGVGLVVPCQAQSVQVSGANRTVSVTATSQVIVMADVATVHLGFQVYGPDSDTAYANGSRVSNAIAKALAGAGVAKETIESEAQSLTAVQNYGNEKLTPAELAQRKFQVQQGWTVRTAADDAAKVLDVAVKAGANQSGEIDWSLANEGAPEAQAATKALERARSVASGMATGMGAKLGALLYASNTSLEAPVRPMPRVMAFSVRAKEATAPLSINPRRIEKSATVTAIFAIE